MLGSVNSNSATLRKVTRALFVYLQLSLQHCRGDDDFTSLCRVKLLCTEVELVSENKQSPRPRVYVCSLDIVILESCSL